MSSMLFLIFIDMKKKLLMVAMTLFCLTFADGCVFE